MHLGLVALVVPGADSGEEIDEEAEHVPRVDEGDNPFEYSGNVPVLVFLGNAEYNTKTDFYTRSVAAQVRDARRVGLPAIMKASFTQKEMRRIECSR